MAKKAVTTVLELSQKVAEDIEKKPVEVFLKFTLPPPTYKATITTEPNRIVEDKTKGLVKSIVKGPEGIVVIDREDTQFVIPYININYLIEG